MWRYLAHEVRDDPMEGAALVTKARLAGAQLTEVLSGLWGYILPQTEHYPTRWLTTNLHIKEHLHGHDTQCSVQGWTS